MHDRYRSEERVTSRSRNNGSRQRGCKIQISSADARRPGLLNLPGSGGIESVGSVGADEALPGRNGMRVARAPARSRVVVGNIGEHKGTQRALARPTWLTRVHILRT